MLPVRQAHLIIPQDVHKRCSLFIVHVNIPQDVHLNIPQVVHKRCSPEHTSTSRCSQNHSSGGGPTVNKSAGPPPKNLVNQVGVQKNGPLTGRERQATVLWPDEGRIGGGEFRRLPKKPKGFTEWPSVGHEIKMG